MLPRTRGIWHARASIAPTRLPCKCLVAHRRSFASNINDGYTEAEDEEVFDEHEYYQAAEDHEDDLLPRSAGPTRRNITCMGTVAVQNPKPARIGDLISSIQPENMGRATLPNTLPSILLLLLTPTMAQHALSADLPLQVLQRFGENPTASKPLDAITAVVDRLPVPGSSRKGEEGLAYHFATSPGPLSTLTQVPLQSSAQKPGSLTFQLPKMHRWYDNEPALQLPLSQTIFSVGLPSTMLHMRYEFDPLSGLLRKSASQRLEAQTVRVPVGPQDTRILLDIPLVPLTPLRRVVNSMGNIVRKVSQNVYRSEIKKDQPFAPAEAQSASQELEAAVTDYFKLKNAQPEPVQVWALIVPRRTFEVYTWTVKNPKQGRRNRSEFLEYNQSQLQDSWVPRESITDRKVVSASTINKQVTKLIGHGARLCQVLSGGGGWGKKAGLISLDPDTSYSTRDLRADKGWAFDFDDNNVGGSFDAQQRQALGDIVQEGDGIMLFLARKDPPRAPFAEEDRHGFKSLTFGVLPSSIDESHADDVQADHASTDQRTRHHPRHFGMLSEGGMALILTKDGQIVTQTKLDVPFEQLVFTNVNIGVSEDGSSRVKGGPGPERKPKTASATSESTSKSMPPSHTTDEKSSPSSGPPIRKVDALFLDDHRLDKPPNDTDFVFPSERSRKMMLYELRRERAFAHYSGTADNKATSAREQASKFHQETAPKVTDSK